MFRSTVSKLGLDTREFLPLLMSSTERVHEEGSAISAVFESDEYRSRIDAMQEEEKHREEAALHELGHAAAELEVAFLRTPHGFAFVPMKNAEATMSQEEFEQLPEERQQALTGQSRRDRRGVLVGRGDGHRCSSGGDGARERAARQSMEQQAASRVRVIGDYALGKTLGAGSMGKVKLAHHIVTGERVRRTVCCC